MPGPRQRRDENGKLTGKTCGRADLVGSLPPDCAHAGLIVDDALNAGGAAKALAVQQHARLDLSLLDSLSGHRLWIDLVQLLQRSCAACCNTFSVTGLAATLAGHDVGCWAGVFEIEGAALLLLS